MPGRGPRVAAIQVNFVGGKCHNFVIVHRVQHVTGDKKVHPAESRTIELDTVVQTGEFDLRAEFDARDLEIALASIHSGEIESIIPTRNARKLARIASVERTNGIKTRHETWKQMRKNGMSYGAIAKAEGVSANTVYKAINGRARK